MSGSGFKAFEGTGHVLGGSGRGDDTKPTGHAHNLRQERAEAATKIQALFRGHRQRRANRLEHAPTLHMAFNETDTQMSAEEKATIKHKIGSLYGVNAQETSEHPSLTVNFGSKDSMREEMLSTSPVHFGGKLKRAIKSMGFAKGEGDGSALGVTNQIGGNRVYLNANRLTESSSRIGTAVHEVGHALGLDHPPSGDTSKNIMHPTETGRMASVTTPTQRATTIANAQVKQGDRSHLVS